MICNTEESSPTGKRKEKHFKSKQKNSSSSEMLTISVSTKITQWSVIAGEAKVSPTTVTHLSPLTHKSKIMWPHRMKQRKRRTPEWRHADWPAPEHHRTLRGEQVAHLGLQRNQSAATIVFLLPYPLGDGGANRKERYQPSHLPIWQPVILMICFHS